MTDDDLSTIHDEPTAAAPAKAERQVSFGLGMGILFMPIIFTWFLLREGYSNGLRVLCFLWLAASVWYLWTVYGAQPGTMPELSLPISTLSSAPEPLKVAGIGEPIQVGSVLFTFEEPQIREAIGVPGLREQASEGGVLVVVRYSIRNNSNVPVEAYNIPEIGLTDPGGIAYSPDAGKTGAYAMEAELDEKLWSNLNPGITTKAAQVFEVSKDSFNPGTWRVTIAGQNVQVAMTR